jgi:predicted transcriptional regulator
MYAKIDADAGNQPLACIMAKQKIYLEKLAARERQIVEAIYRLEARSGQEATVGDVLAAIDDPPSYSAVRAILATLVQKGVIEYRNVKNKYLYRPLLPKDSAQKSMLKSLLDNFFAGNPTKAVAALLDVAASKMSDGDYTELKKLIEKARKENR